MNIPGFSAIGTANWAEAVTAIASLLTAFAVIFAALQVVLHNRQTHRDFESMYLQRFWKVSDLKTEAEISYSDSKARAMDLAKHVYLELSNDQVSLRELGRITDDTWAFWEEAIYEFCASESYRATIEKDTGLDYRHLRALLNHHKEHNGDTHDRENPYDPLKWSVLRRKFNGL